ncbi:hypothetical protein V1478_008083 [Vespula squamosa]|uniref:Uncharacterized protein n=1 Tax=Vespula squamosa TaxID=30214 RepID=A0ABD2AZL7_VESSQ
MLRTEVLTSIREKGGNVDEKTFEKRIMNPSGVWCPDEGGVNVRSFVYSSLSSMGIPSEIFQYLREPMTRGRTIQRNSHFLSSRSSSDSNSITVVCIKDVTTYSDLVETICSF